MKRTFILPFVSICFYIAVFVMQTSADVLFEQVDVFNSGDDGYNSYRIPAIITAADGSLIAMAEARRDNLGDPGAGDIDLVFKTSIDNGATWSALQVLDDPGEGWGASNPTPVLDRDNGQIWAFFNRWEPGFGTVKSQPGTDNCQGWARVSSDNGATWSAAIDLTHQVRDYDNWGAIFFGPGGAIQAGDGRLLIPAARKPGGTSDLSTMRSYAVYSDDHGATWQRGDLLDVSSNECQFVELADGQIRIDARQWSNVGNRWTATSSDGGQTWSTPAVGEPVTAVCCAIERLTLQSAGDDLNRILWTGPAPGAGRSNLEVRVSYDEGQTYPLKKTIYMGSSAYSDMAILPDDTVGVLWERDSYSHITFTRLNLDWIEAPVPPPDFECADSASFTYKYEFDVDPTDPARIDLDGNSLPDWAHGGTGGTFTLSGNGSVVIDSAGAREAYYHSGIDQPGHVWPNVGFESSQGFTIEWRIKVIEDTGDDAAFGLVADPADTSELPVISIGDDFQSLGGSILNSATGPNDNSDDFHTFRLVRDAADKTGLWWFWRDGELLTPNGMSISRTYPRNAVYFGDIGGALDGIVEVDYFRLEQAAFAPWCPPGDANRDGQVDEKDAMILAINWQAAGADWTMGDFNEDGIVDDLDATILAVNWQTAPPPGSSVPEPQAVTLVFAGLLLFLTRRTSRYTPPRRPPCPPREPCRRSFLC